MRLPGYCTSCHRVRQVSVSSHGLTMAGARRGAVEGVCADCEEERDQRELGRWRKRGDDVIVLVRDARGRTSLRRRWTTGVRFGEPLVIPTGAESGGHSARWTRYPTLEQAEAFAAANGYEKVPVLR